MGILRHGGGEDGYEFGDYPFTTKRFPQDETRSWSEQLLAKDSKRGIVLYRCLGSGMCPIWCPADEPRAGTIWDQAPDVDAADSPAYYFFDKVRFLEEHPVRGAE